MSRADLPTTLDELIAGVVAWHNQHPLARRITIDEVDSAGLVVLPFAQKPGPGADNKPLPLFSEDVVPELGRRRLIALARRHGLLQRPARPDWPLRVASVDRDLADDAESQGRDARGERVLMTAALIDGDQRRRVLIGSDGRTVGKRRWDGLRLGLAAGSVLGLGACVAAVALVLVGLPQRHPVADRAAAASAPDPAPSRVAAAAAPMPASVPASVPTAAVPSPPAVVAAPASMPAPAPHPTIAAATPTASAAMPTAQAAPSAPPPVLPARPVVLAPPVLAAPSAPPPTVAAAGEAAPTVSGIPPTVIASEPFVPRIKPQIAAALRAQHGTASQPASGATAGTAGAARGASAGTAAAAASAAPAAPSTFALVGPATKNRAEAEAMLRRLHEATDRIRHTTATETTLVLTAEGWRVSWYPFVTHRAAENAQAALASRVPMTIVDF